MDDTATQAATIKTGAKERQFRIRMVLIAFWKTDGTVKQFSNTWSGLMGLNQPPSISSQFTRPEREHVSVNRLLPNDFC
ncbi:hypothetical protein RISK_000651 [Rhodopirellula islandica]|uniref:Uncharacterized protein n=1 Tax=Rhodopirellula islandica TaxID=595434 RepID=A0A0J1BM99_RHOIS|nr:hypothetical protein RISK_000651 [Rhodopirellula islandica]